MDVTLLRWPGEDARRELHASAGTARLLLVEDGHEPPVALDCMEDWIRVPASEGDVQARVAALATRAAGHRPLGGDDQETSDDAAAAATVDSDGVLRLGGQWVSLGPLEARLTTCLLSRYGAVVSRDALIRALWPGRAPGRNALDVHVLRLRRRLAPLGLVIRTIRSRGYLLEAEAQRATGSD